MSMIDSKLSPLDHLKFIVDVEDLAANASIASRTYTIDITCYGGERRKEFSKLKLNTPTFDGRRLNGSAMMSVDHQLSRKRICKR